MVDNSAPTPVNDQGSGVPGRGSISAIPHLWRPRLQSTQAQGSPIHLLWRLTRLRHSWHLLRLFPRRPRMMVILRPPRSSSSAIPISSAMTTDGNKSVPSLGDLVLISSSRVGIPLFVDREAVDSAIASSYQQMILYQEVVGSYRSMEHTLGQQISRNRWSTNFTIYAPPPLCL